MINIELDPYEQKDIIEYLKYAQEQKVLNKPKPNPNVKGGSMRFDTTNYDVDRIDYLIKKIETKKLHTNTIDLTRRYL